MLRFVDAVIDVVTCRDGCPRCGGSTALVQSSSAEFPDGSAWVQVWHHCDACKKAHVTSRAFGYEAEVALAEVVKDLVSSGEFEPAHTSGGTLH